MRPKVKLSAIVEAMSFRSDEHHSFVSKKTCDVITLSKHELQAAHDGEPLGFFPPWQQENVILADKVLVTGDYWLLPDRIEYDEFGMMERFCVGIGDTQVQEKLRRALSGDEPFKTFRLLIREHEIADDWYTYRKELLKTVAIQWCEEKGVLFDDS